MEDPRKEMFKLWKSSFDSYAATLRMMTDFGEKMMDACFTQGDAVRAEGSRMVKELAANTRAAQEDFIKTVNDNFGKMEEKFGANN